MAENVGPYTLVKRLATGGMGEVYLAKLQRGRDFEKLVTVKKLLPQLGHRPGFAEMFCSEASLSARLNHANIVQIYDFGDESGNLWLAMEYVRGVDLGSLIACMKERNTPFGAAFALQIVRSVCRALDYAHRLSDETGHLLHLVHRDVTPSNVLVSFEGEVKLTDFGLASVRSREQIHDSAMAGKLPYLPPETIRGERVDRRSDIYALGLLLYELATGERAFSLDESLPVDRATEDLLQRIVVGKTPWNRATSEEVPGNVLELCRKASAPEPGERFQSCKEFLSELEGRLNPLLAQGEGCDLATILRDHFEDSTGATEAFPEKTVVVSSGATLEKTQIVGEKSSVHVVKDAQLPDIKQKKSEATASESAKKTHRWLWVLLLLALAATIAVWMSMPPATGSLIVTANVAGASVVLPGQKERSCPAQFRKLPAEKDLKLTVRAPFHEERKDNVRLEDGKELTKHVELTRLTRMVKIQSDPPEAEVTINERVLEEKTPLILTVPLGIEQRVSVKREGYASKEEVFTVAEPGTRPESHSYRLIPQQTRFRFEFAPANAIATVGGRSFRQGDLSPPVTSGRTLRAVVGAKGYHTKTVELQATANESEPLRVSLERWNPQVKLVSRHPDLLLSQNGQPAQKRLTASLMDDKDTLFTARTSKGFFAIRLSVAQTNGNDTTWKTTATCNFNAQPWARFTIDGQTRGETPVSAIIIEEGAHRIEFQLEGSGEKYALSLALR